MSFACGFGTPLANLLASMEFGREGEMNFSNLFSIAGVDGSAGSKAPEGIVSEMVSANGPAFLNELVRILGMRAEGGQTLSDHLRAEIDRASESEAHPDQDEEAPVFSSADYGIVGDLFEVVPAITEEIKKLKG